MNITSVQTCATGWRTFCGGVYLVRGAAKRAIRVIVRPVYGRRKLDWVEEEELAKRAAIFAAGKGWKTIIAEPDDIDGSTMCVVHPVEWMSSALGYGAGHYLCSIDELESHCCKHDPSEGSWYDSDLAYQ